MNKRKVISFIQNKGIYSREIEKQIDETNFNLTDPILRLLAEKLKVNYDDLLKEYINFI